ncbi:unnamed protein product [Cuscuta epithymum]|uniref:F-box domain-containing protein n=1 Tax=Cuscuta epithymum TaxID=186058 RepID=A0AAV0EP40_9ASTE|nr:unnamed protein product [Cuscuta epithymum]
MAGRDRISQLPEDILDHILGLVPIQDIAKFAVLSTIWRDIWFTLTQLCFDSQFFSYFDKKYQSSRYVMKSSALYVINKVLLQHKGTIRKIVIDLTNMGVLTIKSRSFDFDQWLGLVTRKGVEEVNLYFGHKAYRLPHCIFSCSTLKSLHLRHINVQPWDLPDTLPNLTSLYFEDVEFDLMGPPYKVVDVPLLKKLLFKRCKYVSQSNITARNLCTLKIKGCFYSKFCNLPTLVRDLVFVRNLDLDYHFLKVLPPQTAAMNVESLKLSNFRFQDNGRTSAFVRLLRICPKLQSLGVRLSWTEDSQDTIDSTSACWKKLHRAVRKCKQLRLLQLGSFHGIRSEMLFIKEMLASLRALEKVIITCAERMFDDNKKHETLEEVLQFPRTSPIAKIVV